MIIKKSFLTDKTLFFFLGLFSSIAIIRINLGFIRLTPYNFILYIIAGRTILYGFKNKVLLRKDYNFFLLLLCLTFSCIINLNLPNTWINANLTMTVNYLILGIVLLLNKNDFFLKNKDAYVKGLWISSWVQLVWGTAQFLLYRLNGQSLNQLLFADILHIEGTNYTMQYLGLQRITGLHWECAYYALSLTIGMILASRRWQKILFLVGILLSTSRTGVLTALFAIFIAGILDFKKNKSKIKNRLNLRTISIYSAFTVLFIMICVNYGTLMYDNIIGNLQRFQNLDNDSSALVHMWYYEYLPDILFNKFDIIHFLFGVGSGSSGYMYSRYYAIYSTVNAWTIENEFANQLVGNGIIGAIATYTWIIKRIRSCENDNYKALIFSIVIGGITYSYLVNWVWMVVFMLSIKERNRGDNFYGN